MATSRHSTSKCLCHYYNVSERRTCTYIDGKGVQGGRRHETDLESNFSFRGVFVGFGWQTATKPHVLGSPRHIPMILHSEQRKHAVRDI
jgi:hypothetical protein